MSYAVLETNVHDPIEEWTIASRSFHEWLDHLITAQEQILGLEVTI